MANSCLKFGIDGIVIDN